MVNDFNWLKGAVDYLSIFHNIDARFALDLNGNPAITTEKANKCRVIARMFNDIADTLDSIVEDA